MKIRVLLTRTIEELCELEISGIDDARQKIEKLTVDDFGAADSYYTIAVENSFGEDITCDIQPEVHL